VLKVQGLWLLPYYTFVADLSLKELIKVGQHWAKLWTRKLIVFSTPCVQALSCWRTPRRYDIWCTEAVATHNYMPHWACVCDKYLTAVLSTTFDSLSVAINWKSMTIFATSWLLKGVRRFRHATQRKWFPCSWYLVAFYFCSVLLGLWLFCRLWLLLDNSSPRSKWGHYRTHIGNHTLPVKCRHRRADPLTGIVSHNRPWCFAMTTRLLTAFISGPNDIRFTRLTFVVIASNDSA